MLRRKPYLFDQHDRERSQVEVNLVLNYIQWILILELIREVDFETEDNQIKIGERLLYLIFHL
jgi:hypothetical protein